MTAARPSYVALVAALRSEFDAAALESLRIQLAQHTRNQSSLGTLAQAVIDAGNIHYDAGEAVHPAVRAYLARALTPDVPAAPASDSPAVAS